MEDTGGDQDIALFRGKPRNFQNRSQDKNSYKGKSNQPLIQCQICNKFGRIAIKCWYHMDQIYNNNPNALMAADANESSERIWIRKQLRILQMMCISCITLNLTMVHNKWQ